MPMPYVTGTQALNSDPTAQQILSNRQMGRGLGNSNLVKPVSSRPLEPLAKSRGYSIPSVHSTERTAADVMQMPTPTATNRTGQAFISPVSSKQAGALITAKQYLGTPYKWGGTGNGGFDCSGFTQMVSRSNGVAIPRTAEQQFNWGIKNGRMFTSQEQARPGDLVYFRSKSSPSGWHTGVYIGNGKMIDAAGKKSGVKISNIAGRVLRGFVRVFGK